VAEQVGLALQHARRIHEQTVLSMSTASTASVHELAKAVGRLRALSRTYERDPELADALREIADHVAKCIQSGAELTHEPRVSLSNLLTQVLRDLGLEGVVKVRGTPRPDLQLRASDVLSLRVALTELFDNAKNNVYNSDPQLEARWSRHTVGGRDYATLLIGNTIGLERSERLLRLLFRLPLRDEDGDRVHLGAFTAAVLVRSMGGDVFVHISKPPAFVVGVDIPLDLSVTEGEAAA